MKQILLPILLTALSWSVMAITPIQVSYSNFPTLLSVTKPNITIFPNPASEFIQLSDYEPVSEVIIFNLIGRKMRSFDIRVNKRLRISDLPNGIYLVQLLDHQKKVITTQRISKK